MLLSWKKWLTSIEVFPFCPPYPQVLQVLYLYLLSQLLVEKIEYLVLINSSTFLPLLPFSSSLYHLQLVVSEVLLL